MENTIKLRNLIKCLNPHAFAKYVFELFSLDNGSVHEAGDSIPHNIRTTDLSDSIGEYVFEHHRSRFLQYQEFRAVFLYTAPIDLVKQVPNLDIADPTVLTKLKKYKDYFDDRRRKWYFPQDGDLRGPEIAFITNYSDIAREAYDNILFPKFSKLLDVLDFNTGMILGSIDSFLELGGDDPNRAFDKFISTYRDGLSLSLVDDKFSVNTFLADNYIASGVLRASKAPCEPVFVNSFVKNNILREFENLINAKHSEAELENFLKRYYQEIFGFEYDQIETQLWLRFPDLDISNKSRRLDIFLRNSIQHDWDLFEIKKPIKLTRTYRDVPVFTDEIATAIQQLRNYGRLLSQDKVKKTLAQEGIEYYVPSLNLVVGRSPNIPHEQWRWLKSTNQQDLKIVTYDELLATMRTRLKNHL